MFGKAYNNWYATLLYILIVRGYVWFAKCQIKKYRQETRTRVSNGTFIVCFRANNGMEVSKHSFYYVKA